MSSSNNNNSVSIAPVSKQCENESDVEELPSDNQNISKDAEDFARVQFRDKYVSKPHNTVFNDDFKSLHPDDDLVMQFDEFGTTPPRTRLKIKIRDWDRKQKAIFVPSTDTNNESVSIPNKRGITRLARSRVLRRNTMDCALLNEMFVNEENKRTDKRLQYLLRDSERESKKSLIGNNYHPKEIQDDENTTQNKASCEGNRTFNTQLTGPRYLPKVVESCNRYMCVSSRPIGCRSSAPPSSFNSHFQIDLNNSNPGIRKRKEFHETFANLIKLGSVDRQETKLSHEEHTWQTELKDLIWLELRAWQADRTMEQQDKYLFEARQGVKHLLTEIINYKFQPRYQRELSETSFDSGIGSPQTENFCNGCLSLYCKNCVEQQEIALKEVEDLLTRLEFAEALYPSSQAMGAFHEVYKSHRFEARIKSMCLWYNITKQNKLKLGILGKILSRLHGDKFPWPVQASNIPTDSGTSTSSGLESDEIHIESVESMEQYVSQNPDKRDSCTAAISKVHFLVNDNAFQPGDSSSSNESSAINEIQELSSYTNLPVLKNSMQDINIFSIEPLDNCGGTNPEQTSGLYRKFIENVLKSRGLAKALSFLHKLHNVILYKVHISLEKPGSDTGNFDSDILEYDIPRLEPEISYEQIVELRLYGYWSEEAKSINLPSYIPSFVFLSGVPLQFMHEFLRMRLETKPSKPNPLSLEQLMKELREGLTLALTHRDRYQRHITTALVDNEKDLERYLGILNHFDKTLKKVFEVYLDYIDQLVLVAASETDQKSALEKEWMFTKLISPMINGMHSHAAKKFCRIIGKLLRNISERLVKRSAELDIQIEGTSVESDESELKWQLLTICRETQSLFTTERERSMKVLFFAKTFCRDVEAIDFHREHYEHDVATHQKDFVCSDIKYAFKHLQDDVLDVRNKLTKIIERVQDRCDPSYTIDLEDQDRQAILSRSREILHQGYKFGFEYHKDIIRLLEQRIMSNKDQGNELNLALGIIDFAKMWMQFVTERCERGRGMRPRWASQGLEFLILACDPQITKFLSESQFEALKKQMDCCISHVIGLNSEPEKVTRKKASPRTRKTSSPAASRSRTPTRSPSAAGSKSTSNGTSLQSPQYNKFLHPQFSLREDLFHEESGNKMYDINSIGDSSVYVENNVKAAHQLLLPNKISLYVKSRSNDSCDGRPPTLIREIRLRDALNRLDMELEEKLREKNLIGQVKELKECDKVKIRARSVHFRWHRGIKIGQGRFGKVYTAVNNNTGELMAMKEISIQPGESRALKNVAEELKILEGIKHKHLVRYYGIEVHREELLIFMELCSEGTLESLVEMTGGLPEGLTRRFTAQLLSGVAQLHKHGIVHRDIKTANIFLVDGSNSLKLGDFGSAVKIQAHTTVAGELQGYVGTQAYMAPEIFTKTNSDGHGRAADIWSLGCVIVEMASGKRPWAQFDSNFQIMFKVGMGEKPEAPDGLSQEGHDFLNQCLQHDPQLRMTAIELLEHNFCKYRREDDQSVEGVQEEVRKSFRRHLTRI